MTRRSVRRLVVSGWLMLVRKPVVLLGAFLTPLLLLLGFQALDPTKIQSSPTKLAVAEGAEVDTALLEALRRSGQFRIHSYESLDVAMRAVRQGEQEAVLFSQMDQTGSRTPQFVFDDTSIRQVRVIRSLDFVAAHELAHLIEDQPTDSRRLTIPEPRGLHGRGADFIDFVFPGALVAGILLITLFSIPVTMGSYRERGILRRFLATPIRPAVFIFSDILARLGIALVQVLMTVVIGIVFLDVSIKGSFLWLAVLIIISMLTYFGFAYVLASFASTAESASTLGTVVAFGLLFFSDTIFRTAQVSPVGYRIFSYLPVAKSASLIRGLTLDGLSPLESLADFLLLLVWMAVALFAATIFFRPRRLVK